MSLFVEHGSKEIWVRAGKGETTRFIPLHLLSERLGNELCSVLPVLHSLIGTDITGKIGTKRADLQANPVHYLTSFGRHLPLPEEQVRLAEEFLTKVLKVTSKCKNFMELRSEIFSFLKLVHY